MTTARIEHAPVASPSRSEDARAIEVTLSEPQLVVGFFLFLGLLGAVFAIAGIVMDPGGGRTAAGLRNIAIVWSVIAIASFVFAAFKHVGRTRWEISRTHATQRRGAEVLQAFALAEHESCVVRAVTSRGAVAWWTVVFSRTVTIPTPKLELAQRVHDLWATARTSRS